MELQNLGEQFLNLLRSKSFDQIPALFHPDATGRMLISSGLLTAYDAASISIRFKHWFGDSDPFELLSSEISSVGKMLAISYKFKAFENSCWYEVEQQTFSEITDGRIKSFNLLCSGFQKVEG